MFDYFQKMDELMNSNPEKVFRSFERHEQNLSNNLLDLHFAYNQIIDIYYKHRTNSEALKSCIDTCKKDIEITPQVIDIMHKVGLTQYYDINNNLVTQIPRFPSFARLAIIYDKQKKYEEAIKICNLAIKYNLEDGTQGGFDGRKKRLLNKLKNPPKPQKALSKETIKKNEVFKESIKDVAINKTIIKDSFLVTFSESTSNNFDRAIYLAKQADYFETTVHNNKTIYQATYKPENHLKLIQLYDLIKDWKSTFVFINGDMMDKKVLGQINFCHGDKIRSNDDTFCYGASMFTENPFGCHRLMIHSGQKPWYKWIKSENNRHIIIDKEGMNEQIDMKAETVKYCPAFNYGQVIKIVDDLPDKINKNSTLYKKYFVEPDHTITLTVRPEKNTIKKTTNNIGNNAAGCGSLILFVPVVTSIVYMFSKLF